MTDSHCNRYTVSTHRLGDESRIDDQGYLHTGRSQRQPQQVVVTCGRTEVDR